MDVRVTGRDGPKIPVQTVSGEIRGGRFAQTGAWIIFKDARLFGVDLSHLSKLFTVKATASVFEDCDFGGVRFRGHDWGGPTSAEQVLFRRCSFDRSGIDHMQRSENVRFEGCTFRKVNFKHWQAAHCEFIDCAFSGTLKDVEFAGRPWDVELYGERERAEHERLVAKYRLKTPYKQLERMANEFRGNDFRNAKLVDVSFAYGIDLNAQMLPEGPPYLRLDRPRERIERARSLIARWTDDHLRERGLFLLRMYSEKGYEEQTEIFINRNDAYDEEQRRSFQPTYDLLERVLDAAR